MSDESRYIDNEIRERIGEIPDEVFGIVQDRALQRFMESTCNIIRFFSLISRFNVLLFLYSIRRKFRCTGVTMRYQFGSVQIG